MEREDGQDGERGDMGWREREMGETVKRREQGETREREIKEGGKDKEKQNAALLTTLVIRARDGG